MSELIFIAILIISMLSVFVAWVLLSRIGLYTILITMCITAYITSFKIIHFFGLNINVSIIPFITILETIYIIKEVDSQKSSSGNTIILVSTAASFATLVALLITNSYVPSINDLISNNIKQMLQDNFFITISYPFIIIITVYLITKYYEKITKSFKNKYITNTFLYITIGLIYSVIFSLISYIGKIPVNEQLYIGVSTYIIGLFITILYLPLFGYLTNRKRVKL